MATFQAFMVGVQGHAALILLFSNPDVCTACCRRPTVLLLTTFLPYFVT